MPAFGMEPLAFLAAQPAWQAAQPIPVNVDYDVPAFGTIDAIADLQDASNIEHKVAIRQDLLEKALSSKSAREITATKA
jgi:hypothetical protein